MGGSGEQGGKDADGDKSGRTRAGGGQRDGSAAGVAEEVEEREGGAGLDRTPRNGAAFGDARAAQPPPFGCPRPRRPRTRHAGAPARRTAAARGTWHHDGARGSPQQQVNRLTAASPSERSVARVTSCLPPRHCRARGGRAGAPLRPHGTRATPAVQSGPASEAEEKGRVSGATRDVAPVKRRSVTQNIQ